MADDKFAHLLQPIRDIAANWNIDIASELEEYMEVLESVNFSFADGGPSLNFAEAALLIQGSACVYGKKVEYLHSLVYQALEFVADRKCKQSRQGGREGEAAADAADESDEDEKFLNLDDMLEEGACIDLDEDHARVVAPRVRLPSALLALENFGYGDGEAGYYRIASCAVHHSGALLLDPRDGDNLDVNLQPIAPWVDSHAIPGRRAEPCGALDADASGAMNDVNDEDDFGGGGFDDADHEPMAYDGNEPGATAGHMAHEPDAADEADLFDPYKPLDPNARGSLATKPFKRASQPARRPQAQPQLQPPAAVLDSLLTVHAPAGAGLLLPEFGYALPSLHRAGSRAAKQAGDHCVAAQRAAPLAQLASAFTLEDAAAMGLAETDDDDNDADAEAAEHDGGGQLGDDGDDYGPAEGFGVLPEHEHDGAAGTWLRSDVGTPVAAGADGTRGTSERTYEELCRAHIEALITAAAAAEVQTELASRVTTWREKMTPVLEEEQARPAFDIHSYGERLLGRMAELRGPVGDAAAQPSMVHGKGPQQHSGADTSICEVTFGEVVQGVEAPYDISRSFSSMLQLINNGNVRLTKLGGSSEEFRLALLDAAPPQPDMGEWSAHDAIALPRADEGEHAAGVLMQMQNKSRKQGAVQAAGSEEQGIDKPAPAAKNKRRKA